MIDQKLQMEVEEISRIGPVEISDKLIQSKLQRLADLVKNLDDTREDDILFVLAHFAAIAEMIESMEAVHLDQDRLNALQSKFDRHAEHAGEDFKQTFDAIIGNFIDRD